MSVQSVRKLANDLLEFADKCEKAQLSDECEVVIAADKKGYLPIVVKSIQEDSPYAYLTFGL